MGVVRQGIKIAFVLQHRPFFLSATSKLLPSISPPEFSKEQFRISLSTSAPPIHYSNHCSLAFVLNSQLKTLLLGRSPRSIYSPNLMNFLLHLILLKHFHVFLRFFILVFTTFYEHIYLFPHSIYLCFTEFHRPAALFTSKLTYFCGINDFNM